MSDSQQTTARLSRPVPLDQLRPPETDVRDRRPEDAVQSLAASMGDPDVGQLQDILVHPVDHDDLVEDGTEDELQALYADDHPLRIVDGETRRLAAEMLGWATIDATIVPAPPNDTVIAQLDANTERVDMTEYETVRALYDWKEQVGATVEATAEKAGFSPSYMSDVFSTFDSPDWLVQAWRHPDHPLETSHARAVKSFLTDNTVEAYADAGNLTRAEAYDEAEKDAKLMIDVQQEHDLQVGEFRKRCSRLKKQTKDELDDNQDWGDKQGEAQAKKANNRDTGPDPPEPDPCLVCGGDRPHGRRFAVPVCADDYGMLSDMEARGELLIANAEAEPAPDSLPHGDLSPREMARQGLAEFLGAPASEVDQVLDQLEQQAAQAPQEAAND
jgi:ParB/RepB/Spo0J family partition protein